MVFISSGLLPFLLHKYKMSRERAEKLFDTRKQEYQEYFKRMEDAARLTAQDYDEYLSVTLPNASRNLDKMEFFVYETQEKIVAKQRPIIIITSNNEKELPDAFLRRCFFHYIRFPEKDEMQAIVDVHFPNIKQKLLDEALAIFFDLREVRGLKKKPSTSELIDWLKLLLAEDISPEVLHETRQKKVIPPLHGALLKNEQDVHLFEKLAFMHRGQR